MAGGSIDVIVPLGIGSKNADLELRYCLRGIEKHLSNVRNIYIIGERPKWITNIIWKSAKDERSSRVKERNIFRKISLACKLPEVSENFLFINDDHFILSDFDAETFPYHYKCNLSETKLKNTGNYRRTINHTRRHLINQGIEELDFDTHCPILYNKNLFLKAFEGVNWNLDYGYGIKSMYCGINGITGEHVPDCKIQTKQSYDKIKSTISGRGYFSIGDGGFTHDMKMILEELYPNPSIYEKE